jgi:uncharacterized protein with HEPN domain
MHAGFLEGMAKDAFLADKRTQQAVIMSLIIIGEAAAKVMDGYAAFAQAHSEVPWRSMRGMRNRIAHGYFDINLDVVWNTVQTALPELLVQLPVVRQGRPRASMIFEPRTFFFRRLLRLRIDPVGDADLGFGFLQGLARLGAGLLGAHHVGQRIVEGVERSGLVMPVLAQPEVAVGTLHDAAGVDVDHGFGRRRGRRLGCRRLAFRRHHRVASSCALVMRFGHAPCIASISTYSRRIGRA